jgi:hypothetical protein
MLRADVHDCVVQLDVVHADQHADPEAEWQTNLLIGPRENSGSACEWSAPVGFNDRGAGRDRRPEASSGRRRMRAVAGSCRLSARFGAPRLTVRAYAFAASAEPPPKSCLRRSAGRPARALGRNQPPGLKCLGDQARSSIVSLDEPKCAVRPRPGLGGRRHVEIGSGTRGDARVES